MKVTIELDDPMPMTIEPIMIYANLLNLKVDDYDPDDIATVISDLQSALEVADFYYNDERDAPLKEALRLLGTIYKLLKPVEEVEA